jgi:Ca2+-binding RTX toxin-like protein
MIISTDTTWATGQTVNLTEPVEIAPGVTLTIEPGVTVEGDYYELTVFGNLLANGTPDNPIVFETVVLDFGWDAVPQGQITISHALVNGGYFYNSAPGALYLADSALIGTGFYDFNVTAGDCVIERNIFLRGWGIHAAVDGDDLIVRNNVFLAQDGEAVQSLGNLNGGTIVAEHNSFLSTDRIALALAQSYDGYVPAAVAAPGNYFGTTDAATIDGMVIDRSDSLMYASYIAYQPVLEAPDPATPSAVVGTESSDHLNGTAGRDFLAGLDGSDTLWAGEGNDILDGGSGEDVFVVMPWDGADRLSGGDGADLVSYEPAWWGVQVLLPLGAYGDTFSSIEGVVGSNFDDLLSAGQSIGPYRWTLYGGMGNDVLVGGPNRDLLSGGYGDDYIYVTAWDGADIIDGGPGYDVLSYAGANTPLYINLSLRYGDSVSGIEEVHGSLFRDLIIGTAVNDRIDGNEGDDRISGKAGNDTLTGGGGVDSFVFDVVANALTNNDTITDFVSGTDRLEFSRAVFVGLGTTTGALAAEQFWSGAGVTSAQDSTDRIIYDTTTGALYYDADGLGGVDAVQVAALGTTTHPGLVYSDVQIIG